jgi:hypothetical protein
MWLSHHNSQRKGDSTRLKKEKTKSHCSGKGKIFALFIQNSRIAGYIVFEIYPTRCQNNISQLQHNVHRVASIHHISFHDVSMEDEFLR